MTHEDGMRQALALAQEAADAGEVPVGCVIVRGGEVVGRGRNRREERRSALAHAELDAIAEACAALGDWRLADCTLYVTLEPCPMCAGAILNARVGELRFGAREPESGSCGSILNLFAEDYAGSTAVYGGLLAADCAAQLRAFFRARRGEV